jgi:hypothetical protein
MVLGMDGHKKQAILKVLRHVYDWRDGGLLEMGFIEELYDTAHQHGRESLLRAAQELVGGRSVLDDKDANAFNSGKQAVDSLGILGEWMELDPGLNRYDSGLSTLNNPGRKYQVTVWRRSYGIGDINYHIFFGSAQMDALANAAQSVVAEVEEARKRK